MLGHLIKLAITVGLFTLIFSKVEFSSILGVLAEANWWLIGPALLIQILSAMIASYRWYLIMNTLGFRGDVTFYIKSYLKGTFFNQALPASIGGDALRVLESSRMGNGKREAFYGVFIDRIVGLVGLTLLNLFALLVSPILLEHNTAVHYIVLAVAFSGVAGILILALIGELEFLTSNRVTVLLYNLSHRFRAVYRSPKAVSQQLSLSLIIHLVSMITVYLVGQSVGLEYGLLVFLVMVPPVILLTIIPISLAGWGVREGGMIGLFVLIGADKTMVLAMSLLYGIILLLASIPGMYLFLLGKRREKEQTP